MENLVTKFYNAFANLDAEAMVNCYHESIVFEDPAFGVLNGEHAKNMWRMLCASQKGKDFKVAFSNIEVNETFGSIAHICRDAAYYYFVSNLSQELI